MEWLARNVRRGIRRMVRDPGFTAVVLICVGLGVGANTAVFSVIYAVLLKPLPYHEPDDLVMVWTVLASAAPDGSTEYLSRTADFEEFRNAPAFADMAALVDDDFDFGTDDGPPERVRGGKTTAGLFQLLGTAPLAGRLFRDDEELLGRDDVVIISDGLFQRRFGGDPAMLGRRIEVDARLHTLIGVVPDRGGFPLNGDVWIPLPVRDMPEAQRSRGMLTVLGRLAEGTDLAGARAGLTRAAENLRLERPDRGSDFGLSANGLHDQMVESMEPRILAIGAGVLTLLLLACANIANLLLVRSAQESRGTALRSALGATRRSLVGRTLVENGVLGAAGGLLGVILAYAAVPPVLALMPDNVPGLDQVRLDLPVLGFGLALALGTLLLAGMVPALVGSTSEAGSSLRTGERTGVSRRWRRIQGFFVVVQMALGLVLLVGSGLLVKSLVRLASVDPGFVTEPVTFKVHASLARYPDHGSRLLFFRRVLEEVRPLPGVVAAGAVHAFPIGDIPWGMGFSVEDHPPANPNDTEVAFFRLSTPGYVDAMGIPLAAGRDFNDDDVVGAPLVALVSQTVVDKYWPGESGIGERIKRREYTSDHPWLTVVGVVEDVHDNGLSESVGGAIYLPLSQHDREYSAVMNVVVRSGQDPVLLVPEIQKRLQAVDPNAPIFEVRTVDDIVTESLASDRVSAVLTLLFSGLGLILAGSGMYGVLSHIVGDRRREIAIRMAVGAPGGSVARQVAGGALKLAGLGIVAGLIGSLTLSHMINDLLFEVQPLDRAVFLAAPITMIAVVVFASLAPAVAAARIDPVVTLRS